MNDRARIRLWDNHFKYLVDERAQPGEKPAAAVTRLLSNLSEHEAYGTVDMDEYTWSGYVYLEHGQPKFIDNQELLRSTQWWPPMPDSSGPSGSSKGVEI